MSEKTDSLDDLFTITCGRCQQSGPLSAWCNTPLMGALPVNEFQCPNCGAAFRREPKQEWKPWQKLITLTPIQARL